MALTQVSTDGIKNGTITGTDLATNVDLVDSQRIRIGTGNDLQIFHNGTHSFMENSTGILAIRSDSFQITDKSNNHAMITATADGAAELYHDNSKKFQTDSDGVEIFGNRLRLADNVKAAFGSGADLQIYHTGSHSYIADEGTGELIISGSRVQLMNAARSGKGLDFVEGSSGYLRLYQNNNIRFETTSTGTRTTGVSVIGSNAVGMGTLDASTQLVVTQLSGNNNSVDLTILGGRTGKSAVVFGDHDDVSVGSIIYDHSNESISFRNNNSNTDKMFINSSGDVGINTSSPNSFSGYKTLTIQGGSSGSGIDLELSSGDIHGRFFADANGVQIQSAQAGDSIRFETAGANERMRIDSSGNVGIGLTNPSVKLDVNGATTIRVANSTSYQSGLNVSNSVTTDLQVWIKNNAVALGPSTASDINFVTGGNTGTRLTIASNGDATFSRNLILEGGSNHAYPYIELHSSATSVRKWRIFNGQGWNPDALLIYDIDGDNTALTIEPQKLGINKGANSLTDTLEVGGDASITGNLTVGTNNDNLAQVKIVYSTVPTYLTSTFDGTFGEATLSVNAPRTSDGSGSWGNAGNGGYGIGALQVLSHPSQGSVIKFLTANADNTAPSERVKITGDGNTVFTDKDSGHIGGGVYSRTKSCAPGNTNFMKFTLTHGALAGAAYGTASNNARSIAKSYTYAVQFADNSGLDKQSDSGPMGGTDFTIGIDTASNAHTFKVNVTGSHTIEVNLTVIVGCANQDITYTEL